VTSFSSAQLIAEKNPSRMRSFLESIEWFDEIGSTNDYLLAQPVPAKGQGRVAIAKHQTAGRGRRGQEWLSSSNSSICLSMCHTFANQPDNVASISLAVGASIAAALKSAGAKDIALKWPNDLMVGDAKIAGILAENHACKGSELSIVVGIGLNINLRNNPQSFAKIVHERALGDLTQCLRQLPTYEEVAMLITDAMHHAFVEFGSHGFGAFFEDWQSIDWLRGKPVEVFTANRSMKGICGGIDLDGALLLGTNDAMQRIVSGSVRIDDSQCPAAHR